MVLLRAERREYLESGLDILTDRERTALLLRDVEDMPAEQVAEHLELLKGHRAVAHCQRQSKTSQAF